MDKAEKINLLRGAQRLAAMSEGRISADAALKALIREGLSEEIPGAGYRSDIEAEEMASFGANQDDFQSDRGRDFDQYQRQLDEEVTELDDAIADAKRTKNYKRALMLEGLQADRAIIDEERGPAASAGRLAPKSVIANALRAVDQGAGIYGYDAFPGAADVAGRLEETLQDGKISKEAADSLASELVRRDAQRFQSFYRNVNNVKAQIRYEQALRNGEIVTPDVFSQPNTVVRPVSQTLLRASSEVPYGPIDPAAVSWQNIDPVTGADLSAPPVQGPVMPKRQVSEFVNRAFDSLDPNKSSPQVSINEVLGKVNAGISDLGGVSKVENARDLTEFAKRFVGWAKNEESKTGKSPIVSWRDGGTNPKPIPVSKATIDDVLTTIGIGAADHKRLGYALGQIALAGNDKTAMPEDFMYDSGAGNKYDQKIEYQRIVGDNRGAPGTRGVPGSTPPVRTYSVRGKQAEGPAVFNPQSRTYRAMPRTQLSKLIEGPQAILAADSGLDRTKPSYNKFGVTDSPRELRELIVGQAVERAAKTGKDVDLGRAMSNADKAIAVTRRARRDNAERKEKNRALMRFGPYNRLLRGGF